MMSLKRVLKLPGTCLRHAWPRHLWQLKEAIYAEVKEHTSESLVPQGFEQLVAQRISYNITRIHSKNGSFTDDTFCMASQ